MKLVTFGINRDQNLIVQFPVFIQPHTQQPLILYQIEMVPAPIIDMNKHIISTSNNDIPVKIPSHPYVLVNRSILCN